jgi:membrane complex biogenesis BtpA family protein
MNNYNIERPTIDTNSKTLIGMIHVPALPGTPFNKYTPKVILNKVIEEASIFKNSNIDSIMIENMHDAPFLKRQVGPEITSMMTIIGHELRKVFPDKPLGVQILAGANKEALGVALAADLDYIRGEGFVFAQISDEGFIESDAGELLRYRKYIGADKIKVFTDIKKKHSANFITSDVSIGEMAKNAQFFGSDGVIITGNTTGAEVNLKELIEAKESKLPVLIGSGITYENLSGYFPYANAFIVGSYFKKDGLWSNNIDNEKLNNLVQQFNNLKR